MELRARFPHWDRVVIFQGQLTNTYLGHHSITYNIKGPRRISLKYVYWKIGVEPHLYSKNTGTGRWHYCSKNVQWESVQTPSCPDGYIRKYMQHVRMGVRNFSRDYRSNNLLLCMGHTQFRGLLILSLFLFMLLLILYCLLTLYLGSCTP